VIPQKMINKQQTMTGIRRSQSKLSGPPAKANLRDIQHVIYYADNREGWRKFSSPIQNVFRFPNRKRNAAFDLVGIELNPGPNGAGVKSKNNKKKTNSQPKAKGQLAGQTPKRRPVQQGIKSSQKTLSPSAASYLRTVLSPCSGNSRIPDLNTITTSLVTLTTEGTMVTNSNGIGGMAVNVQNGAAIYTENSATTADTAYTYSAPTNFPSYTAFNAANSVVRIVSACIDVQFTGATLSDAGIIVGWSLGAFGGTAETAPLSNTSAFATRCNQSNRTSQGISIFYRPSDSTSFDFRVPSSSVAVGVLGFHISGTTAASPFRYHITFNYECVPNTDSMAPSITNAVKASPVDVEGHAHAVSIISQVKPLATFEQAQHILKRGAEAVSMGQRAWESLSGIANLFSSAGRTIPKFLL
jgi:hypothetical protein